MTNLDPLSLSVILKAVDFLVGQAEKFMQEYRQNNLPDLGSQHLDSLPHAEENEMLESFNKEISIKEIQHCLDQIRVYTNNVHVFEKQVAIHGGEVLAPPELINKANASKGELAQQMKTLKTLLESATNKKITISGFE